MTKIKVTSGDCFILVINGILNLKGIGEFVGQWHYHKVIKQNNANFRKCFLHLVISSLWDGSIRLGTWILFTIINSQSENWKMYLLSKISLNNDSIFAGFRFHILLTQILLHPGACTVQACIMYTEEFLGFPALKQYLEMYWSVYFLRMSRHKCEALTFSMLHRYQSTNCVFNLM